ncbi:hypothetical protein AJ78_05535 [Emergomyces pasteurianus Ep9510]|uniref:Protein kinase domain-containing protein n=1 Tax=Emergomyces pasteurianus Ep9510 TaxID=1447872 RepID=A0A1J9PC60_9EURO|nr:hypothetical protein AJ78_05535 [Emergomyces pasteurianus Ep9510]
MRDPVSTHHPVAEGESNSEKHEHEEQNEGGDVEKLDSEEQEIQEQERYDELSMHRETYWIVKDANKIVSFTNMTNTKWKLGKTFSERVLSEDYVSEASARCVATQVEGPDPGLRAIVKIRKQSVASLSHNLPEGAHSEFYHLRELTESGATCTPKLIDYIYELQSEEDIVTGGFLLYILMEKVPGIDLRYFEALSLDERDQVRIAVAKALHEFHNNGFYHEDTHGRNIMWDRKSKRAWIIDLEGSRKAFGACRFTHHDFFMWSVAGLESSPHYPLDPLTIEFCTEYGTRGRRKPFPSDKEWAEMVANAKGKPSIFHRDFQRFLDERNKTVLNTVPKE